MDYILNKLTDISLRRLYKFVLKRTIGKYLEDELLIDQLEVHSRDGIVRLSDIRVNAQVLNEELMELLPIKIVSIAVNQLEVHMSYKTLLTDSCRFVVDSIDIVLAPNELYLKSKANQSAKPKGSDVAKEGESLGDTPAMAAPTQTSEEGQKGLSFIAHWIEVIVARLQVQVGSINVTFQIPAAPAAKPRTGLEPPLSRSKLNAPVTHHLQLCLRGLHYFNDDPKAYSATDASSVALSTKLVTGTDASVAAQLGARKIVKLEVIVVQLVPIPSPSSSSAQTTPPAEVLQLLRLGSHLAAAVKLDKTQAGQLRGLDIELTVPHLHLGVDVHSAKCLGAIVTSYLALTTPESPRPGASASDASRTAAMEQASAKSLMQKVLMSDPTLRTLFWLEEEENRKKKAGGKVGAPSSTKREELNVPGAGGDEIDFARLAQLMRQYRTTRNALVPEPLAQSTLSLGASAMLGASRMVESDSDGDFPASVNSSGQDTDTDKDADAEGDDSSVDSAEFHDAFAKKPVLRVKMGESGTARRSALQGSAMGLGRSTFGGASKMGAESGLFHSTTSGLLGAGSSQVHNSGYSGSVYAAAAPPLVLSVRLHVLTVDVVFTHLSAQAALRAHTSSSLPHPSTAVEFPRDELCLHLEESVIRLSTVINPAPPAQTQHTFLKATNAETPRNSVTCNISLHDVQVWEAYGGRSYETLRALLPPSRLPAQKQVLLSFHALQDSRRIYSSPHINVSVDYVPGAEKRAELSPPDRSSCASIKATVNFEPIVASASVALIEHWVQGLSGFPLIGVAEEESSTNIACSVNIVQVELFLHCDDRAEGYRAISQRSGQASQAVDASGEGQDAHVAYWDTVLDAVDLAAHPEAWTSLHATSPASPYYEHLISTRGGFRFLLADISIKLATAARAKVRSPLADSGVLEGSISSAEKKACRANSAEALFQAVEMTQVALYVYISLPVVPTLSVGADTAGSEGDRRRFYSTLLVKASASDNGAHKVMISRTNPNAVPSISRLPSEDPEDQDFVLLRDAYRTAPSVPTATPRVKPEPSKKAAAGVEGGGQTQTRTPTADQGPTAPVISTANLIYVSAYHIQVDIKQREYNVLMMVSDSIAPKPFDPETAAGTNKAVKSPTSPRSAGNSGFGFVLSSKIATICLSDNEPYAFAFPEFDALIAEARRQEGRSRQRHPAAEAGGTKTDKSFSICVSIIEPSIEVLISNKDIYLSIKADDLSIYEMELPQFRALLQSGFDFNQTTGREARYGPNRHLVPFIRRASLHTLDTSDTAHHETFSTLLGNNQDYGRAFEVRLLLTSTTSTAARDASAPVTEVKSVHFFIDFHDIMLSYDPQSTWILSVANMLTPQTAAQILCHRQEERVRAAVRRYQQLTPDQREMLGTTLDELVANLTAEQSRPLRETPASTRAAPAEKENGTSNSGAKKGQITLTLPFELTKVNVRVRNCIVDFCCDPCSSRTFLTIGLLTVTATIASNSQRFSLKFKVGGLSLYISDVLPLPTVQEVRPRSDLPAADLNSSILGNSALGDSFLSVPRGKTRFRKNPELFGTASQSAYSTAAARAPGGEVFDEDIGQFFRAHSFVDLASVDHIDVLVTINNSEAEALVIQINIGQCSINACVDSLELFAKTMSEWFLEFQIACAKSEEVMQKKSNKPLRDLGASHYAFRAPSGNLLDDDSFDTIRFCDTLPGALTNYRAGGGASPHLGAAVVAQALPAGLLEDVPLSAMISHAEKEGINKSSAGVFLQSAAATSDMTDLMVEDYYSGLSLPSEPTQLPPRIDVRPNTKVGVFSPFPTSPHDTLQPLTRPVSDLDRPSAQSTAPQSNKARVDESPKQRSLPEPKWVAQYDYEDQDTYSYDYPPTAESDARNASAGVPGADTSGAGPGMDEEVEGAGGFYATDPDEGYPPAGLTAQDMVEMVDDDDANGAEQGKVEEERGEERVAGGAEDGDDGVSLVSVESIVLDESLDEYGEKSGLSQSDADDGAAEEAPQMSRSVFGLGNFSYWTAPPAAKVVPEEVELKDFNPNPTLEDSSSMRSVEADLVDGVQGMVVTAASPTTTVNVTLTAPSDGQEWLQQELAASPRTFANPQAVVMVTSHQQSSEFTHDSDPEDGDQWRAARHTEHPQVSGKASTLEPQYEADFGYEESHFEADFGDDGGAVVSGTGEGSGPVRMELGEDAVVGAVGNLTTRSADEDGQGWKRFPEGLGAFSVSPDMSPRAVTQHIPAVLTAPDPVALPARAPNVAVMMDDLDRAWQQQVNDYVYSDTSSAGKAPSDDYIRKQQAQLSSFAATTVTTATPATLVEAGAALPVLGERKAGKVVQPMQSAQWYENPEQLEIMPHYIPVVSRSEDLDDNRPAEEKSLSTKMLMKLKGTFKIRLFEGSDWHRKTPATVSTQSPEETHTTTAAASTSKGAPVAPGADASGSAGGAGKSVRFRKDDLLRDLTTPHPAGQKGAAPSSSSRSGATAMGGRGAKPSSGRPPRSSRPLFEETVTAAAGAPSDSNPADPHATSKASQSTKEAQHPPKPRNEREMLDATFKELFFCVRVYDNSSAGNGGNGSNTVIYSLPAQRVAVSALDFLISFGKVGMRRKKVLGSWTSPARPRDTLEPVLRVAFLTYENPPLGGEGQASADTAQITQEHRLYVRVLPLRCYLDEQVINFAKALALQAAPGPASAASTSTCAPTNADAAAALAAVTSEPAAKELYFQSILVAAMHIKIDYRASTVNIQALNQGDYLQLLNIFPLDGLEITLKHVKLNGVRGAGEVVKRMGEFWVKDIYANQLHRVISGTAPFRGLSNIGNDLQELLAIPLRDYRKSGGTMKHLRRSTRTLVRTVTRETLHATQQLTMFVANAISELASDGPAVNSPAAAQASPRTSSSAQGASQGSQQLVSREVRPSRRTPSSTAASNGPPHQPSGVVEGLQLAYGSVTRELGSAAETVIAIPIREYVHTGPGGYLKSVIRAFPIAVLRPVAGVVEGISYTMLGLRNNIDPAARLDEEDVWNVDLGAAFPGSPVRVSNTSYQIRDSK